MCCKQYAVIFLLWKHPGPKSTAVTVFMEIFQNFVYSCCYVSGSADLSIHWAI